MDYVLQLDQGLFYLINIKLTTSSLDFFMPFITTKANFINVIIFAWLIIFIMGKWKDRKALIIVVLAVLVSDLATDVLKNLIYRVRPCNALADVRILAGCTESFSFPSGHATNVFAVAVYLSYIYRRYLPILFILAILVAYSRVYTGAHYPLDVAGGAVVGSIGAIIAIEVDKKLSPVAVLWFNKTRKRKMKEQAQCDE